MNKVFILGGYGNFGRRISVALVKAGVEIIIAGRSASKANDLVDEIQKTYPGTSVETAIFDINQSPCIIIRIFKQIGEKGRI